MCRAAAREQPRTRADNSRLWQIAADCGKLRRWRPLQRLNCRTHRMRRAFMRSCFRERPLASAGTRKFIWQAPLDGSGRTASRSLPHTPYLASLWPSRRVTTLAPNPLFFSAEKLLSVITTRAHHETCPNSTYTPVLDCPTGHTSCSHY